MLPSPLGLRHLPNSWVVGATYAHTQPGCTHTALGQSPGLACSSKAWGHEDHQLESWYLTLPVPSTSTDSGSLYRHYAFAMCPLSLHACLPQSPGRAWHRLRAHKSLCLKPAPQRVLPHSPHILLWNCSRSLPPTGSEGWGAGKSWSDSVMGSESMAHTSQGECPCQESNLGERREERPAVTAASSCRAGQSSSRSPARTQHSKAASTVGGWGHIGRPPQAWQCGALLPHGRRMQS